MQNWDTRDQGKTGTPKLGNQGKTGTPKLGNQGKTGTPKLGQGTKHHCNGATAHCLASDVFSWAPYFMSPLLHGPLLRSRRPRARARAIAASSSRLGSCKKHGKKLTWTLAFASCLRSLSILTRDKDHGT